MKAPATPENETDRLNSLRESGLLEIDSSPAFDRLTRLAKRFFQVPLAMVNLIDEHSLIVKSADGRRPTPFRVISLLWPYDPHRSAAGGRGYASGRSFCG
jgi:hypothetical protein